MLQNRQSAASLLVALLLFTSAFSQETPTEVVIVGTHHFISDMPEGYTPAHLRALLKKIAPTVLAVEADTNAPDPWSTETYELASVTKPWAAANGILLAPCGWGNPGYQAQIGAMIQDFSKNGKGWAYQKTETEFQMESSRFPLTCERMNSDANLDLWRRYHSELHRLHGQATPWETWNDKIAKNVVDLCAKHRGKRVAVVFGSAHAYYLTDALAKKPGIAVIPAARFFPLTEAECREQLQPQDHVKALRLLNLNPGSLSVANLIELEQHLLKITDAPDLQNDYRFFHAKFLQHKWDLEKALAEFESLQTLDARARLVFDGQSRIAEGAAVFAASTKSLLGHQKEARADLEQIIARKDVSEQTRVWAQRVLQALPAE
jgi:hypothetical protein